MWSHGQIQDSTYQMLKTACSVAEIKRQSRTEKLSDACDKVNRLLSMEVTVNLLFLLENTIIYISTIFVHSGGIF